MLDGIELYLANSANVPSVVLEIGCGSGIISAFIKGILQDKGISNFIRVAYVLGIDINPNAIKASVGCFRMNSCQVSLLMADLIGSLRKDSLFDLIICNPPYVPTSEEELSSSIGLEKSWAGGPNAGTASMVSYLLSKNVLKVRNVLFI